MTTAGTLYDEALRNGMLVLLATNTASNSTFLDFTGTDGPYTSYWFDIDQIVPSVAANLWLRVSTDGGASFIATGYVFQSSFYYYSSGTPGYSFFGGNLSLIHI